MNESALFCTTFCVLKLLVPLYVSMYSQNPQYPSLPHRDGSSLEAMPEGTEVYSYMSY